jgi:hypothetical protein
MLLVTISDYPLWGIIASFIGWEVYAHFIGKNKESHTLSNRIWSLETKYPASRVGVFGACVLLLAHLVFHVL